MSKWLDTRGNTTLSIAICDRCKMKRAYDSLGPDINFPGLRVCEEGCRDQKDPWRLPARQTEKIAIRFPRPDADIAIRGNAIVTNPSGTWTTSPEDPSKPLDNGNLDELSP